MKEHKWLVECIKVQDDELDMSRQLIGGILYNTDKRRKPQYFAFSMERNSMTLEQIAQTFLEGGRGLKVTAMPKKRAKHPTVDVRQMNLFGGQDEKSV